MDDYYYEVSFELVSNVPFYSPSTQTTRVLKRGAQVRIDTTFTDIKLGCMLPKFETVIQSHIYRCKEDSIDVVQIDNETRLYSIERYNLVSYVEQKFINSEAIYQALTQPISTNEIDLQHFKVSAMKEGWIKSVDKIEVVDNIECAVHKFSGILLRHWQRSNHLQAKKVEPKDVTELAYFKGEVNASPKLMVVRRTEDIAVKAWMTTDKTFPLTLEQHVLPILDLISIDAREFKIKRDLILSSSSFPPGFPLQLELPIIPLVLKARLKFSNIQAKDIPVSGISMVNEKLVIQDYLFNVPKDYQLIEQQ